VNNPIKELARCAKSESSKQQSNYKDICADLIIYLFIYLVYAFIRQHSGELTEKHRTNKEGQVKDRLGPVTP